LAFLKDSPITDLSLRVSNGVSVWARLLFGFRNGPTL